MAMAFEDFRVNRGSPLGRPHPVHHPVAPVNAEALERAFWRRKRHASMEVNGMAVTDYKQNLEASLQDLRVCPQSLSY